MNVPADFWDRVAREVAKLLVAAAPIGPDYGKQFGVLASVQTTKAVDLSAAHAEAMQQVRR